MIDNSICLFLIVFLLDYNLHGVDILTYIRRNDSSLFLLLSRSLFFLSFLGTELSVSIVIVLKLGHACATMNMMLIFLSLVEPMVSSIFTSFNVLSSSQRTFISYRPSHYVRRLVVIVNSFVHISFNDFNAFLFIFFNINLLILVIILIE